MRFSAFTLVFASLLVLLPASAAPAPGDAIYLNSRDVLPAHRMIRRRALGSAPVMINRRVTDQNDSGGLLGSLFGGGDDGKKTGDTNPSTNTTDPSTGDTTTNSTTTTTDPNAGSTNTTDPSGTTNGGSNNDPQNPVNPNNGGTSPSASNVVASTPAAATQSTSSASSTASVASASSPSPSATLNLSFLPTSTGSFTDPFATDSSASSTATDANASIAPGVENKSAFSHTTIVILIVVASCAAAAAIIWTAIRKWKFSPSRQFEDRLQRIDWQPSTEHENQLSAGLGGGFRHGTSSGASQRDMSERRASHGSFGSSDRNHPADNNNDGVSNVAPDLPPAHDFTAGPAATYANLARGPSLNRGASLTRGNTNVTRGPSYGRAYYGGYGTQQQQPSNYGYGY